VISDAVALLRSDPVIRPFEGGPEFLFDGFEGRYYDLLSDASTLYSVIFLAKLGTLMRVPCKLGDNVLVQLSFSADIIFFQPIFSFTWFVAL
jgi:hypothetical protein